MASEGRRIGIFGGAFDPPTLGHTCLISEALNYYDAHDRIFFHEVWVEPTGGNRGAKDLRLQPLQRLKLLELAINEELQIHKERIKIQRTEIDHGRFMPSYELIQLYKSANPSDVFWIIVGADQALKIDTWIQGEELKRSERFFILPRLGEEKVSYGDSRLPNEIEIADRRGSGSLGFVQSNASSSEARKRILHARKHNDDRMMRQLLTGLVPPSVVEEIIREDLYRNV